VSESPIIPEVLPPGTPIPSRSPTPASASNDRVAFHPASSALMLVVDNLWNFAEFAIIDWFLTIPLSFLSVFFPTYWIQRRFNQDRRLIAAAKALFLGIVAAVPFSVTGTPIGIALLAWAGIRHKWK
jgi:hypothetical protein